MTFFKYVMSKQEAISSPRIKLWHKHQIGIAIRLFNSYYTLWLKDFPIDK